MKSDPRDYQLDISSIPKPTDATKSDASAASGARPFLSVMFNCCQVYQRVYRAPDGQHYQGRCPKCMRTIKFVVAPGGTATRSFVVE